MVPMPEPAAKDIRKPWYRRWYVVVAASLIVTFFTGSILVVVLTHGQTGAVIPVMLGGDELIESNSLCVMTVNLAHGRGSGSNQMFQGTRRIQRQLDGIADLIIREEPKLIALQEADAQAWWSGGFSHPAHIGAATRMLDVLQARNVDGLGLHYGAALLSQLPMTDGYQHTFGMNYPTFSKGFIVAACTWPGGDLEFDLVSVHLDFASKNVRQRQFNELQQTLQERGRPLIIMGDFNTEMESGLLGPFMEQLHLHTWQPENKKIVTFPGLSTRIDWILVSRSFRIIEQRVLSDDVSDHLPLVALIERVSAAE